MKKSLVMALFSCITYGQVAIGKTSLSSDSVLLEFYDKNSDGVNDNVKGIILPYITDTAQLNTASFKNSVDGGIFVYDSKDHKVKVFSNNTWLDLSDDGSIKIPNNAFSTQNTDSSDELDGGIIIGDYNNAPKGAFVLNSANKAMILPKIKDPHSIVKNPFPGMICYDTIRKALAVFNGSDWTYWK